MATASSSAAVSSAAASLAASGGTPAVRGPSASAVARGSAFADLSTGKKNDSPPPLRAGSEVVSVALTFAEDLNSKNIEGIHNVNSTKEANVCADRGMCNGNTGQCECFLGFKMGSMHGTGACDTIEGHTALRGDGVPLTRKMEFKGTYNFVIHNIYYRYR
jgi:hypothetical protein